MAHAQAEPAESFQFASAVVEFALLLKDSRRRSTQWPSAPGL